MTWKSTGPLSYQGSGKKDVVQGAPTLQLTVQPLDTQDSVQTSGRATLLHPDDFAVFNNYLQGAPAFLQLAQGSDYLARAAPSSATPRGHVCMEHVQRHNMHVAIAETYSFSVWEGPEDPQQLDLVDVSAEVRPLPAEVSTAERESRRNQQAAASDEEHSSDEEAHDTEEPCSADARTADAHTDAASPTAMDTTETAEAPA
jgi:hypothetical protein